MDYFDQIEAYVNNALSESEREAFENAMNSDAKLKQAVEDHSVAMDIVGGILEDEVRKVIVEEELTMQEEQKIIKPEAEKSENLSIDGKDQNNGAKVKQMNWMRWAAAAVVLFLLGWWGNSAYFQMKIENEVYAYYNENERPKSSGVRGDIANINLEDSIKYYFDLRRYDESLMLCNTYDIDLMTQTVHFYKVHNLFNLKQYDACIDLINKKPEFTKLELQKIKVLALLMTNKKRKALELYEKTEMDLPLIIKLLEN